MPVEPTLAYRTKLIADLRAFALKRYEPRSPERTIMIAAADMLSQWPVKSKRRASKKAASK
jgi:hypothetical protein